MPTSGSNFFAAGVAMASTDENHSATAASGFMESGIFGTGIPKDSPKDNPKDNQKKKGPKKGKNAEPY